MKGPALALLSAALFGASIPLAKLLLGALDPWLLAGLLYLGSGLGLALLIAMRKLAGRSAREAPLRLGDLPRLAAIVLFGGVAGPLLLMVGLDNTPASSAALLLNLEGLATLAIAWTFYKEHVDRRIFLGAMAILTGALALSWPNVPLRVGWGGLAVAGACLAWAIDNNLTRRLSARDPVQVAALKGLTAGGVNLMLALAQGSVLPAVPVLGAAALVGVAGYGVSLALFVLSLRYVGTARTGAYFGAAPFIGAALAIPLLGEPVTVPFLMAAALMGWGVWIHLSERHAHEHAHAPLEHDHRHAHDTHHRHDHARGGVTVEPHSHAHRHDPMVHSHRHHPDLHHHHDH